MISNETIEKKVDELVSKMTLEQKVGQTLVLCFTGPFLTPLVYRQILDFNCAGMRIHQNPFPDTRYGKSRNAPYTLPEQYAEVLNKLQDLALSRDLQIPLHFVLDQEGDTSANYHMGGVHIMPSQTGLVACGDKEYARKAAYAAGKQLRAVGVTWAHSPVLDVNTNYFNPEVQERAFNDDPQTCSEYAAEFFKGLKEANVIGTAKHFPGRGDSGADAHHDTTVMDIPKETLISRELKPYIDNLDQIPSIMIAHSAFLALDPTGLPATVSKPILTDFLRGELGFKGVLTTDNMEMDGITKLYPIEEACWRAVAAGTDLVLMKAENDATCEKVFHAMVQAVKDGALPIERVEEANRRVLKLKMEYGIFDNPKVDASKASDPIKDKEIIEIKETAIKNGIQILKNDSILPLKKDSKILVIEQTLEVFNQQHFDDYYQCAGMLMSETLKYSRNLTHVFINTYPDASDIEKIKAKLSGEYDVVVLSSWSRRSRYSFAPIVDLIKEHNLPVVNLINSCYPHAVQTNADAVILSFQMRGFGVKALVEVMFGDAEAKGKWPLKKSYQEMLKVK